MNDSPLFHCRFSQHLTRPILALIVGLSGISVANMASALPVLEQPPLLMAQSTALAGNWRLANMTEDPTPTPMVPAGELTVEFAGDRISGSGGCNRFTGSFDTEGNQLQVSPLASTFKACEQSIMDQETRYLTALQGAQRYELDDQGQLTIFYQTDQTSGVLRFTNQTVRGMW
ncbi:META domain-containing protein [Leptolyngbya sp. NK1-12]|uniref:META domain-containing protein n=1 Tax=Leptolyngbya sp. NK1-12 TaxID=2547451 RepID=A0AA96WRZ3_9CYAN|nr:META domain-containing protein [Leptolyngbya sp. NK1-12]WNZ21537.1 META domain-containing protein [Leptolyngbya sp. NK1-12]